VSDTQPPLEYLVASSQTSLQSFLLSRAARLAELRQEIHKLVKEWVQIQGDERTARWILKYRNSDASRPESPALPPRALSTLDFQPSLFLPAAEEDGKRSHAEKHFSQQSSRLHSRVSRSCDRRSKFRAEDVGAAADLWSDDRRRNSLVRSVCAIDSRFPANKGDSVGARLTHSSSDLPLAFPPEFFACDAVTTADIVATSSEPNICPGARRCNSNVCAIAAAHLRRASRRSSCPWPLENFALLANGIARASHTEQPTAAPAKGNPITLRRQTRVNCILPFFHL
jgi:hypothetical protein